MSEERIGDVKPSGSETTSPVEVPKESEAQQAEREAGEKASPPPDESKEQRAEREAGEREAAAMRLLQSVHQPGKGKTEYDFRLFLVESPKDFHMKTLHFTEDEIAAGAHLHIAMTTNWWMFPGKRKGEIIAVPAHSISKIAIKRVESRIKVVGLGALPKGKI